MAGGQEAGEPSSRLSPLRREPTRQPVGGQLPFRFPGYWSPRTPTGIPLQTFSRPLLKTRLRDRVLGLRNVRVRPGVRVVGLTGDAGRVTGVRVRGHRAAGTGADPRGLRFPDPHHVRIVADLVVDASGRNSRLPGRLTACPR
ncbi:MAG: hypothetical protein HOZ81_07985 [Streptomyces sp.]|nr:hypothetical protein [Streptomyces sp.]NUT27304.1 hypothetical protein [Streptomyces sp.]